jgi:SET domain-containing protein
MKIYYIDKSNIHGKGIFSKKIINKNMIINKGIIFNYIFIPFITPYFGSLINHSTNSNCILKYDYENRVYNVCSIKKIKKNTEITLNYNNLPWFCSGPEQNWTN